jgi:hypothetical protein
MRLRRNQRKFRRHRPDTAHSNMHGPIFNRRGDQVGYVEGDWALDRSGQKRFVVDGAKLLHPATLEIVGYLTDAGKINTPNDNSPAGNSDPADRLFG